MNQEIRSTIIKLFGSHLILMESNIPPLLQKSDGIKEVDTAKTVHLMKDIGELTPEGQFGALRLTSKAIEAQAPLQTRFKRYMLEYFSTHWLAVVAIIISVLALFKK